MSNTGVAVSPRLQKQPSSPLPTISSGGINHNDDARHRVLVERERRDRPYGRLWETEIGNYPATEQSVSAERRTDEYRVRTLFALADMRVLPVASSDPRRLVRVSQPDIAKELRSHVHNHPGDLMTVYAGGTAIERLHHGLYSAFIDTQGTSVSPPTPQSTTQMWATESDLMTASNRGDVDGISIGTASSVAGGVTAADTQSILIEQEMGNDITRPLLVGDKPQGIVFASGPSDEDCASVGVFDNWLSNQSHAGDSNDGRWGLAATHGGHSEQ